MPICLIRSCSYSWTPTIRCPPPADLGHRKHRIAIQYDGGHHPSREQQSRDNRRDEFFVSAGWSYFKASSDDLAGAKV